MRPKRYRTSYTLKVGIRKIATFLIAIKKTFRLFITVPMCEYMFTYLKEPIVPRSGKKESEKVAKKITEVSNWEF
jgi:hypothetical protein